MTAPKIPSFKILNGNKIPAVGLVEYLLATYTGLYSLLCAEVPVPIHSISAAFRPGLTLRQVPG